VAQFDCWFTRYPCHPSTNSGPPSPSPSESLERRIESQTDPPHNPGAHHTKSGNGSQHIQPISHRVPTFQVPNFTAVSAHRHAALARSFSGCRATLFLASEAPKNKNLKNTNKIACQAPKPSKFPITTLKSIPSLQKIFGTLVIRKA
jgi:hypothetical protein